MDPMLGDSTSLSSLPAATPGPVDPGAFAIFQPLYEAVLGGLGDVINNGVGTMIGYVHEFFVPMCTIGVILMAIAEVCGASTYLFWLVKYLVRAGVVLTFIDTAGDYARWIVTPIRNLGDNIAAALAGALPGAPGHIFDVLMAHYSGAVVQTVKRMPWSSILGALESIVLASMALGSWLIAFLAVGVAFAVYLIVHIYLAAILIVGPLFVALAMAGQLRNWLMGWLNALASQVLSLILLGVGLTILTRAEDQVLQSILNVADNVNFWSSLGHLFGGMVALCIGAVYALTVRGIAVGIVGGVYAAMQPYVSAIQTAVAAGAGAAAGSGGGSAAANANAGMATPAMAIPRTGP
jgi:type IV secretory pathway VirB6-like protein